MKQLDLLFVRPNSKSQNYGQLDEFKLTAIEPPLWPAILASSCRLVGLNVDIIDAEAEGFSTKTLAYHIKEINPKTLVINICGHNPSASTQSMTGVVELIKHVRDYRFHGSIVLHGLHPSALPSESLDETGADAVIVGEGIDIITKQPFLKGIYTSHKLIDLKILPQPAWDLLPLDKYRTHSWHCFGRIDKRQGYGVVYTSLGCPNNCSFCVIHVMTNNKRMVRYRTIEQVMVDIAFWVGNGVTNIRFIDENFTINRQHAMDVCKAITVMYGDRLNIWAYASPHTLDQGLLEALRNAGIRWLGVGFEAADFNEKGQTTDWWHWEENSEIIALQIKESGIYINANWIFGLPEETWYSMLSTLHLAQRINSEWVNIYCAMAYPGSKLYTEAIEQGLSLPLTWDGYSQYSPKTLPLYTERLQSFEILSFRDYAFKTYYSNPMYQNMIMGKFGPSTVDHIKDILKIELKRDII
jgi:anaerobic magnesium-protoporphyrin IX monomethyl ester cyclase